MHKSERRAARKARSGARHEPGCKRSGKTLNLLSYDALARLIPTSEQPYPGSDRAHRMATGGNRRHGKRIRQRIEGVQGAIRGEIFSASSSFKFR